MMMMMMMMIFQCQHTQHGEAGHLGEDLQLGAAGCHRQLQGLQGCLLP